MKVLAEIPDERVSDLLNCAFDGGIGYWAKILDYLDYEGKLESRTDGWVKGEDGKYYPKYDIVPLLPDCSILLVDVEDIYGTDPPWILDREAIERGLYLMFANPRYKQHASDFLSENEDAETGDVFVQLCLFGEIVYG